MNDSHLTYIGSPRRIRHASVYDVYRRSGGVQLGWVYTDNGGRTWRAESDDPTVNSAEVATRREASTTLWPA